MYTSRITRSTPGLVVLMIDQSGSMEEITNFNGDHITKAEAVAQTANRLLLELANRCLREGEYIDYFDICLICYSGEGVKFLYDTDKCPISISRLMSMDCRTRTITRKMNIPSHLNMPGEYFILNSEIKEWIEPSFKGITPMYDAFENVHKSVNKWVNNPQNINSFPPLIFNITDGEASDGNSQGLISVCDSIMKLSTKDGETILTNIHVGSNSKEKIVFPEDINEIPVDQPHARLLYLMSSVMPEVFSPAIKQIRLNGSGPFRGVAYNTPIEELFSLLNIGSSTVTII